LSCVFRSLSHLEVLLKATEWMENFQNGPLCYLGSSLRTWSVADDTRRQEQCSVTYVRNVDFSVWWDVNNNFLCLSSRGIDRLAFIQLNAAQIINSEFWFSFSSAPNSVSSLLVRHAESTVEMRALISAMLILNDYCCINVEYEIKAVAVITFLGMYVLNYVWSYNYGKIYSICIGLSFLMIFCPNKLNVSKFLHVQTGTMSLVV
jgi:hypothetical protein